MKKLLKFVLILISVGVSAYIIYYIAWPFADRFIQHKEAAGDALMHLANIIGIQRDHPFPILAWKPEWGGYSLIEGYPWVHYYVIQAALPFFNSPGLAMDYYMAAFLIVYYFFAFLLLFYVSRNVFWALFFTLILIYGADSHFPMSVNAFMTFTATQFFLPLLLLLLLLAREKNSTKLFLIASVVLAVSFYAHGSMTGMVFMPIIIPFLLLNHEGKITKHSLINTMRFFVVFALVSSIQVYQFIDYNAQGYLRGVKPFPLDVIPERFSYLMSWVNPVLFYVLIALVPLFLIAVRKNLSKILPYFLSLCFILIIFTLMLFNITSMNLVLLAERTLWGISLSVLLLFSIVIARLAGSGIIKHIVASVIGLSLVGAYLYLTLIIKPAHLIPDTLRAFDPYKYNKDPKKEQQFIQKQPEYKTKFDLVYSYPPLPWSKSFDNYRADGISWAIYSNWNIWSSNPRYKGRFPAAKGLPLEWSGLVSAAQYGKLGEAGTADESQSAINQTIFFFDWYGIRHLEIGEGDGDLAKFLRTEPLIESTDKSKDIIYHNMAREYVGPIYAPTNVKTMAVISPKAQYDAFIRILSYSEFTSKRLIPIYLGQNLGSINRNNLKYFDSVFLYGYKKSLIGSGTWNVLKDYVKNGGFLIIETGQKVGEGASASLPEVFPVTKTELAVVRESFNIDFKDNELTNEVDFSDLAPLKTKYLPYAISQAPQESLKNWAKPVLTKDGNVVMAYGNLDKGIVVWSGLNLPFHAIDNRNKSEIVIFANILKTLFPDEETAITDFNVEHPNSQIITVSSKEGRGFLIKENYNPGWSAKLNNKKVKILRAGLFQMYIPFDGKGEQKLELNYYGNPFHWLLFFISLVSLVGILIYLFTSKIILFLLFKVRAKIPEKKIRLAHSEEEDY